MSQALYIWANGVAPSLQVSSFSDAEKTAYSLYREAKFNTAADPTGSIQQWIDYVAAQLGNSDYADHFPDALVAEARRLQKQLSQQPQAVVELDMLMREGGGEALDRVLYEGIQRFKLGVYDYRYPLWRNGDKQLPADGVGRVLAGLPALTADVQQIDLDHLEVPRNLRAGAELMYNWLKQHPVTKDFEGEWFKDQITGSYECIFSKKGNGIKKIFHITFLNQTYVAPSPKFIVDFSEKYIVSASRQEKEERGFKYVFNIIGFVKSNKSSRPNLAFPYANDRWNSLGNMQKSLQDIDKWMREVFHALFDERSINNFFNHSNRDGELVFSERDYRPFLKVAATMQDYKLTSIYEYFLSKIPLEYEQARKDLINFYENDIAEISRIVAAKKQGN